MHDLLEFPSINLNDVFSITCKDLDFGEEFSYLNSLEKKPI